MKWAHDYWFTEDKFFHLTACFFFCAVGSLIPYVPMWWVLLLVFVGGVTLECWQEKFADGFSYKDLAADVAGIALFMLFKRLA